MKAVLGVLTGSFVAAVVGYLVLVATLTVPTEATSEARTASGSRTATPSV